MFTLSFIRIFIFIILPLTLKTLSAVCYSFINRFLQLTQVPPLINNFKFVDIMTIIIINCVDYISPLMRIFHFFIASFCVVIWNYYIILFHLDLVLFKLFFCFCHYAFPCLLWLTIFYVQWNLWLIIIKIDLTASRRQKNADFNL